MIEIQNDKTMIFGYFLTNPKQWAIPEKKTGEFDTVFYPQDRKGVVL